MQYLRELGDIFVKKVLCNSREEKKKGIGFENYYYMEKSGKTILLSDLLTKYVGVKKLDESRGITGIDVIEEFVNDPNYYLKKGKMKFQKAIKNRKMRRSENS